MKKSLLWKTNKVNTVFMENEFVAISMDLGLKKIIGLMSREPDICLDIETFLSSVTFSHDDILYRQGILSELDKREDSMELLEDVLSNLKDISELHRILKPELQIPLLMLRIRKLESYCNVMDGLKKLFCSGMNNNVSEIANEIEEEYSLSGVPLIKESLIKCHEIIDSFKSMAIGVNLDEKSLVREAIILQFNDYKYEKNNLLDKISSEKINESSLKSIAPNQDIHEKGQYIMFTNRLYAEMDSLLNKELHLINNILELHSKVITSSLIHLIDELSIYYGSLRLKKYLADRNYPVVLPLFESTDIKVDELYSITMVLESTIRNDKHIKAVKNEFYKDVEKNLLVITGANDGGKTVYLEAIAIAQLLGQNGIYVPAMNAQLKIYNKIFTHFPKNEDIGFGTGRLGEEAGRFSEIFESAGEGSLVAANEPYVTTSPDEGLMILTHTIKKLLSRKADVFLVTHYLDLLNVLGAESKTKAYTAQLLDGERTYKMIPDKPMSISHAMDIAKKHGIDKDGIIKMIRERV